MFMPEHAVRPRLLVLDDDSGDIVSVEHALKPDYEIVPASGDVDLVAFAAEEDQLPDLVLMNIEIPGLAAFDVCRRWKLHERTRNIPILLLTSRDGESVAASALGSTADDYVTKPINASVVRARVQTHLELKQHRDRLESLAQRDELTGLPNRQSFDQVLDREWRRSLREAGAVSVILANVDALRALNEGYGDAAGDACLKRVSEAIGSCLKRSMDFLAAIGGGEFAAVLPVTDIQGALHVAEAMRDRVEALAIENLLSSVRDRVTLSLGVAALVPTRDSNPDALVVSARKALQEAKAKGKDQVSGFAS
jgi:two-component system, sensor histidine kinase and response regulator